MGNKLRNIAFRPLIDNVIFEFKEMFDHEDIIRAKKNKEKVYVAWNNGVISLSQNLLKHSQGMNNIGILIDYKKKSILFFPMDDWSDFKFIKKLQQAVKDFIKVGIIDKSYEFIISDAKNTKMNLGGTTVKDVLDYNAEYTKLIPFAFHGTSDLFLDSIKKYGLLTGDKIKTVHQWNTGYTNESDYLNYLSIDFARAEYYAKHAVETIKNKLGEDTKPIVVEVNNLPISYVVSDDDFVTNMGQLQLLVYLHSGKKIDVNNYISSIRGSAQFAYKGRIPAKFIKKIHKA